MLHHPNPALKDNKRRAATMLGAVGAVIVVVLGVIGVVVGLVMGAVIAGAGLGLVIGLLVGAAVLAPAWIRAEHRAMATVRAHLDLRPADATADARLVNLVEGLCVAAGLPRPELWVGGHEAPNAMTLGRHPRTGCLIETDGLLAKLSRIELEAVLAHELAHLRDLDSRGPTVALSLAAPLLRRAPGLAAALVNATVSDGREALADMAGVSLTRYPPGLVAALERLRDDPTRLSGPMITSPLWIEPLEGPPLLPRIEALREL